MVESINYSYMKNKMQNDTKSKEMFTHDVNTFHVLPGLSGPVSVIMNTLS